MSAARATRVLVAAAALGALAAGCGGADDAAGPVEETAATSQESSPPAANAVPDSVLDEITAAAAQQAGVAPGEVEIVRAEDVRWSSAALGCPEEGQMYTQVITDGYWVIVRAGDEELDYRTADGGPVRLCEGGEAPAEIVGG